MKKTKIKDVLLAITITSVISISGVYLGYNLREAKYRNNIFTFCSQDAPPGLFSQCVLYFNSIMDLLNKQ